MLSVPSAALRWIRAFGTRFFHRFGIYFAHEDLRHLWEGHNVLRVREDSVARARCGKEGIIRSERILIHSLPQGDSWSSLNHDTLLATLKLERRIDELLSSRRVPCIRGPDRRCFSLSPLAFWNHNEEVMLNDRDVLKTLGRSRNATASGITITPDMVLAGRGDPAVSDADTTTFLVLTYFFPDADCLANHGHFVWLHVLEDASNSSGDLIMQAQEPTLIALEVDAVVKTSIALPVKERIAEGLGRAGTSNTLKLCTYNSVLGVMAFFSTGAIRQFCAFAIVVLVAHWFLVHTFFVTVLSIDIQRLELHELLRQDSSLAPSLAPAPMKSNQKQAHSNWARFVEGFQTLSRGRAGKNISLVLLLAITATLYHMTQPYSKIHVEPRIPSPRNHFARPPKLTASSHVSPAMQIWQTLNPLEYDLVHVRIESPSIIVIGPDAGQEEEASVEKQRMEYEKAQRARWSRLWTRAARRLAWLTKTVAVPTVATTVLLYGLLLYLLKGAELLEAQRNRPEPDSSEVEENIPALEDHVSFQTLPRVFATDVDSVSGSKDGSVVGTIGLRNELVLWRTKTQTHFVIDTTDLLLGSSGSSPTASSTLTAIALNDRGTYVAVGTGSGVIAVWYIGQNRLQPLPHLIADNFSAVTHIHFAMTSQGDSTGQSTPRRQTPPMMSSVSPEPPSPTEFPGRIYATYENGAAIQWTIGSFVVPTYIKPSRSASVIKSMLLQVRGDDRVLVAFCLEDGTLELQDVERPDNLLAHDCCIAAGNPADLVSKVEVCSVQLEGETHLVIGAATHAGVVSLWDGATGECMSILEEPFGIITDLHLTPVHSKPCLTCGEYPLESFCLSFSIGHVVLFYRCYLSLPTRRCSCPSQQPKYMSSVLGRRSRSSSVASMASITGGSGSMSPTHSRSRISSFTSSTSFDGLSMFPISGHGVHTRRITEKKSLEALTAECEDDGSPPVGPQDVTPATSTFLTPGQQRSSLWENLLVVRVADATFERGGWDVTNDKIVGVRRKPRMPLSGGSSFIGKGGVKSSTGVQLRPESSRGLTGATLERWELWTFDPSESQLQASPLVVLDEEVRRQQSKTSGSTTVGNGSAKDPSSRAAINGMASPLARRRVKVDMVPRLHFTRVSPFWSSQAYCLAGFGNTVGLFNFALPSSSTRQRPSMEHIRKSSGGGQSML
ncbi:hypothetical protein EIP86_008105 [Pleurotus ostreatoroseus]|nr:hypothetical protein EIP86_008105 [Pleurotus ostreatoroseus]